MRRVIALIVIAVVFSAGIFAYANIDEQATIKQIRKIEAPKDCEEYAYILEYDDNHEPVYVPKKVETLKGTDEAVSDLGVIHYTPEEAEKQDRGELSPPVITFIFVDTWTEHHSYNQFMYDIGNDILDSDPSAVLYLRDTGDMVYIYSNNAPKENMDKVPEGIVPDCTMDRIEPW